LYDVLDVNDLLLDELAQRRESGHDVSSCDEPVRRAVEAGEPEAAERLLLAVEQSPLRTDWSYEEPSRLAEIEALRPAAPALPPFELGEPALFDRVHAAWLGRCAGCNLGKPMEGVPWEEMTAYLHAAHAYPLVDYVPPPETSAQAALLNRHWPECTRGRITHMARDDDTDYTILALHILECDGFGFRTADVGRHWLERLPFGQVYTAERAAYRNLIHGLAPPLTATHRNPYREWIGALIRADMFGYVCPGDARRAAGLGHVDGLHARGLEWEEACAELRRAHGHYGWVHTINNAAVVAAALHREADRPGEVALAPEQGGWDTDCNGATAGSAFGAMHGRAALPGHWVDPLSDRIRSALFGYDDSCISELARRTVRLGLASGGPGGLA